MLDGIFASLYTTSVTAPVFLAVCLLSVALGLGIALVYRKIHIHFCTRMNICAHAAVKLIRRHNTL